MLNDISIYLIININFIYNFKYKIINYLYDIIDIQVIIMISVVTTLTDN